MKKIFDDNGTVFIQTYCFESGLWYLAESLGRTLEEQGHDVYYIPKAKYRMFSASFERTYLEPKNKKDFKNYKILPLPPKETIDKQLGRYIIKYNAKYLICFETLMQKANWLTLTKRRFRDDLKIIEVPMSEWVEESYLNSKSYKMFDQIWSLNNLTSKIFHEYDNVEEISWDFIDSSLFNKKSRKRKLEPVNFLHLASTNPDYSTKNTNMVIEAFDRFLSKEKPEIECNLHIQGAVPSGCRIMYDQHDRITNDNSIITREDLSKLYKHSDVIIAPSSREGLSLSLYEGLSSGCKIITTNAEPMNYIDTPYLCDVEHFRRDRSLVPLAVLSESSILNAYKKVYQDLIKQ